MQCKDVEFVVEQEGLAPLPEAAQAHVAGCSRCQGFVADMASIVSAAKEIPAELEPPERVWVSLRTQLELEGIIKTPTVAPQKEHSYWWQGFGDLLRSRALATAGVGLLILVAGIVELRQSPAGLPDADGNLAEHASQIPFAHTAKVLNDQEVDLRNIQLASTSPVDDSLRQNLQQVDSFIADCERHLRANPGDELAREYLTNAYQQKAELLSAMMDREGSIH